MKYFLFVLISYVVMYESFGFVEVVRIPKANKYDDGTYAADIHMVKSLN